MPSPPPDHTPAAPSPLDAPEFLDLLRAGDEDAFRTLIDDQRDRVVNICYRFLRGREDAEDVAQEVFLEVHRAIGGFHGESSLASWIYRIAVSRSLDLIRERKRKKRFAILRDLFELKEAGWEPAAPESQNPAEQAVVNERDKVLAETVAALPENQRVAIALTKYEGMSGQQAAEVMKLSLSAVESLVHRALRSMKESLTRRYGGVE